MAWRRKIRPVIAGLLLVFIWEAATFLLKVPAYILPAPSSVLATLVSSSHSFLLHTIPTMAEIAAGYALAVVVAIPLAIAISQSRFLADTLYPMLVFSQVIPKVALAPLFIIWFGFGFLPKVLLTFLLCFFPIVVSGIAGFRSLDDDMRDYVRSAGATAWRGFVKVRFPNALPSIFVGLKVAATIAVVGAVVAEFVASDKGLGYVLLIANGDFNTPVAFAAVTILSVLGVVLYYAIELLERLVIPWHVSQRTFTGSM